MTTVVKVKAKDLQYIHTIYVFRHSGVDYNVIIDYADNLILIDVDGTILNTSPRGDIHNFMGAKQHLLEYINL